MVVPSKAQGISRESIQSPTGMTWTAMPMIKPVVLVTFKSPKPTHQTSAYPGRRCKQLLWRAASTDAFKYAGLSSIRSLFGGS